MAPNTFVPDVLRDLHPPSTSIPYLKKVTSSPHCSPSPKALFWLLFPVKVMVAVLHPLHPPSLALPQPMPSQCLVRGPLLWEGDSHRLGWLCPRHSPKGPSESPSALASACPHSSLHVEPLAGFSPVLSHSPYTFALFPRTGSSHTALSQALPPVIPS